MSVLVRAATEADLPAFLDLVDGLADYEHLPRPAPDARERLRRDALAARYQLLLGELDSTVVGYAVHFPTYSTFLAQPTLYLEDLFVRPESRGAGVGLALFRACAREAVRQGCGRMEWSVLTWNTPALSFYARLGAHPLATWQGHRLDGEALATVAAQE